MPHEHHRELAPAGGDELHQPLQTIEGVAMDVVRLVDEQHDGLAGLAHQLLEQPLAPFGLGGRLEIGVGAHVEEQRHDEVRQGHARLVDRQAARDDDVLAGADVVLEPVHHHRLARTNGAADCDQAPRPDGREHILAQLAKALGLEVSSVHPVRDDPEAAHDLGSQHSLVPFGRRRNRSAMARAISVLSSVRFRSFAMKSSASSSSAPRGFPSRSAMPRRASSSLR